MGGALPLSGSPVYSTAKAAVIAMCESLRGELAADNIGVSAFCPGPVATNIGKRGSSGRSGTKTIAAWRILGRELAKRENSPN